MCGPICAVDKPKGKQLFVPGLWAYGLFKRTPLCRRSSHGVVGGVEYGDTLHHRCVPYLSVLFLPTSSSVVTPRARASFRTVPGYAPLSPFSNR